MDLLDEYIENEMKTIIDQDICFKTSGDLSKLRVTTRYKVLDLIDISKNNKKMVLNLAINYGGRDELLKAAINLAKDFKDGKIVEENLEKMFPSYLYNPELPDIDLLIRTSGEVRISNFMLWRIAYSELYFTKILWPDFTPKDFDNAIADYNRRIRRFGKTDEQILG